MASRQSRGRDKGPRRPPKTEVTLEFLLTFYEAWLRDYEITKIAAALNTSIAGITKWMAKFPELKEARDIAVQRRKKTSTFNGYVYQRLKPETKKIWDEIQFWQDGDNAYEKIVEILDGKPTKLRQEIFIHALITNHFNPSEACRIACVPRETMEYWKRNDYHFLQLMEEIHWHKKNFGEYCLQDLMAQGNLGAVTFFNRTQNADRGYNEKIQVEHTGTVAHVGFTVAELDLPPDLLRGLLQAVRAAEEKKKTIDAEVIEPKQLEESVA